jgi:hypothetical protein
MMKPVIALLVLVLSPSFGAWAQDTSCPVAVTDVRNVENAMFVLFQNTGSQDISSYEFGFIFVDFQGGQHTFPLPAKGSSQLKVGHTGKLRLASSTTSSYLYPKANAYLMKATLADGTTWTDDGTHSCGATAWQE